ncbi:MAG TPA: hypothetical protein VM866_03995 [Pyrinomonadaceae bacterium]|nr:hypothetical protein [Pyrinomonadaceae bacterium]
MSQTARPESVKSSPLLRSLISYALVFLIAFLIGFIPMWLRSRESANSLAESQRALGLLRLEHTLAAATIDARRGDYEPARQSASSFFTSLRAETDKGDVSVLTPAQRNAAPTLLAQRDEIITLLARSDPASADRLLDLYTSYRKVMNG